MDDGETSGGGWASDYRESGASLAGCSRDCSEELEGEVADEMAEVRAVGPVPGNDGIEGSEASHDVFGVEYADTVKSSGDNGLRGIGKAGQGDVLASAPDLGVIGPEGFESREGDDEISNRTWPNQKASQMNHLL
jgi:hypothetical protein